MRYRSRSGIWLGVLGACAWAACASATQAATCGPGPDVIAAADVAFVGTLTGADDKGQVGTFAVEEVWKGSEVPPVIQVIGAPGQWSAPLAATRYLVLANVVGGGLQIGGECNNAYLWDASMAIQRPAGAHPPLGSDTVDGPPIPILIMAGIVAVLAIASLIAFRPTRAHGE